MRRFVIALVLLAVIAAYGAFQMVQTTDIRPLNADATWVFYTSHGATTAQAPLWAARRDGWPDGINIETRFWKDLEDLRGIMLAGKGDIWVGHIDAFAQAAMRGAPITLVAVTAWKKFHFLTMDPEVNNLVELSRTLSRTDALLAVAPSDSPAFAILDDFRLKGGPGFAVSRHIPRQLMLGALRGDMRHMLLPEPLATQMMMKIPGLRRIACLEEEYSRLTGGEGLLPVGGIAVRTALLEERPEIIARLVEVMTKWTHLLPDALETLSVLPETTLRELGQEVICQSLAHDPVRCIPAWDARREVLAYLSIVYPESTKERGRTLPSSFFMVKP